MSDSHAADVQAELQQYLNSKNINSLFISIVENLLIEKPANPIAFMIEYLNKQFTWIKRRKRLIASCQHRHLQQK